MAAPTLHVRPVEGYLIRDPDTGKAIKGPARVPDLDYWRRRVRAGQLDLVVDEPAPSKDGKGKGDAKG